MNLGDRLEAVRRPLPDEVVASTTRPGLSGSRDVKTRVHQTLIETLVSNRAGEGQLYRGSKLYRIKKYGKLYRNSVS